MKEQILLLSKSRHGRTCDYFDRSFVVSFIAKTKQNSESNERDHPWTAKARKRKEINGAAVLDFPPLRRWFGPSGTSLKPKSDLK